MKIFVISKQKAATLLFFMLLVIALIVMMNNFSKVQTAAASLHPLAAIVIDDVANGDPRGEEKLINSNIPLTFAVMPFMPTSHREAQNLAEKGYQVIVHMPMESYDGLKKWLGPKPVTIDLSHEKIWNNLKEAFDENPYAYGLNNHMGSKATSDERVMRAVFEYLQKNGKFFLNSRTGKNCDISKLVKVYNIKYLRRDVFLDEINSKDSIKKQLALVIKTAKRQGTAVAIGHIGITGNNTAQALKEMLPEFHKNGVYLVTLDDLLGVVNR